MGSRSHLLLARPMTLFAAHRQRRTRSVDVVNGVGGGGGSHGQLVQFAVETVHRLGLPSCLCLCDFSQQSRFLAACRRLEELVFIPSVFDTSPSSLMMWNLQSYPTAVLSERTWHCRGGGSKHTMTPRTYFQGVKTPSTPASTPLPIGLQFQCLALATEARSYLLALCHYRFSGAAVSLRPDGVLTDHSTHPITVESGSDEKVCR